MRLGSLMMARPRERRSRLFHQVCMMPCRFSQRRLIARESEGFEAFYSWYMKAHSPIRF